MIVPKKNRVEVYQYLFKEGVLYAKKDYNAPSHPEMPDVPNLHVIKLMQSFKSRELVTERYAWSHYYWYVTNDGIKYLREYLSLPDEIVPATLKKSTRPLARPTPGDGRREGGRPDRPRFSDREGYRGGEGGGMGRGSAPDKAGAPGEFNPEFRGGLGRGRGGGGY
eukprot:CAMPEP_0197844748 /NCGR_PEP_ID=MMETSP1438-20131217/1713_1 /TAXON_ID=1461541 /ORGANISM="Pterosperma sp., Strain CCMP1384" /LENGTH=165 /DNA_ID=CAMNT_0043455699 /DNA_START=328 /DNA_END=825 /DNA_ORIENTATION=+